MKLMNNKNLLKTFDIKIRKENKILKNFSNIKKQHNFSILKKQEILDHCKNKELTRNNFIYNIKDFMKFEINLNTNKEKAKVISENLSDEINLVVDKIKTLKNNFNSFNNNFFNTFDKYTKQLYYKIKDEKTKDNKLLEDINYLKQKIINLNLKINKIKNNYDELNRYVYIFICIKEEKKHLPNYYKIIIENKIEEKKDELKKINKNEIERISNYKKNIIDLDPDYMFTEIKRYENNNIDLMKRYNSIGKEIILLNYEKEELKQNIKNNVNNISDEIIESKNNILLNLKKKYHKLKKNKQILSSYINKEEYDDEDININHSELYIKTNKLINNFNKYIKYDFDEYKIIIKGDKEKALILHNLTKIETLINCFLNKVNDFKIKNPNKLKLYKMLIDKNKKMRKIMEQKKMKELKLKMENKRINKKMIIL
jgi:hypothetical protein